MFSLNNEKITQSKHRKDKSGCLRIFIKDTNFSSSITSLEQIVQNSFVEVTKDFLGNPKSSNYSEFVNNMLENCAHHSHLDQFPENLCSYSEEQGERFHQDLNTMEERYQGRWDQHMMADYCWEMQRDCPATPHSRKFYILF